MRGYDMPLRSMELHKVPLVDLPGEDGLETRPYTRL